MWPFPICPPVGSHIPFSGRLYMLAPSICFWTPRLSLGHPSSFTSVYELKCMRTQTAPLFNVPRGRHSTTTRVVHPYPHCACPNLGLNPDGCVGKPKRYPLHQRTLSIVSKDRFVQSYLYAENSMSGVVVVSLSTQPSRFNPRLGHVQCGSGVLLFW